MYPLRRAAKPRRCETDAAARNTLLIPSIQSNGLKAMASNDVAQSQAGIEFIHFGMHFNSRVQKVRDRWVATAFLGPHPLCASQVRMVGEEEKSGEVRVEQTRVGVGLAARHERDR